ncbi:MAG: hypothetical protein QY310_07800 [Candidatus Jettenia sp. CY-1]|nr:MAG: hypothetical protein QY310_07800 [Candidatus Jettenia sp. CY-1]
MKCLLPGDWIIRDKRFLRRQSNVIKHFYYGNGKNAKRLSAKFISMPGIYPFGGFASLNPPYSLHNHSVGWIIHHCIVMTLGGWIPDKDIRE